MQIIHELQQLVSKLTQELNIEQQKRKQLEQENSDLKESLRIVTAQLQSSIEDLKNNNK